MLLILWILIFKQKEKLKNSYGEELKWRDLFYIYNLAVNNERYGDKRLTPLFRDYIKERGSLALDYIEFYSKVDNGDVDIFYYDLYNLMYSRQFSWKTKRIKR